MKNDFGKMSPAEQAFFYSLSRKLEECRKIEKLERKGNPTNYVIVTNRFILDELLTEINDYLGNINEDLYVYNLPTETGAITMTEKELNKWNQKKEEEKE